MNNERIKSIAINNSIELSVVLDKIKQGFVYEKHHNPEFTKDELIEMYYLN